MFLSSVLENIDKTMRENKPDFSRVIKEFDRRINFIRNKAKNLPDLQFVESITDNTDCLFIVESFDGASEERTYKIIKKFDFNEVLLNLDWIKYSIEKTPDFLWENSFGDRNTRLKDIERYINFTNCIIEFKNWLKLSEGKLGKIKL